jgi:hypothetical protein
MMPELHWLISVIAYVGSKVELSGNVIDSRSGTVTVVGSPGTTSPQVPLGKDVCAYEKWYCAATPPKAARLNSTGSF